MRGWCPLNLSQPYAAPLSGRTLFSIYRVKERNVKDNKVTWLKLFAWPHLVPWWEEPLLFWREVKRCKKKFSLELSSQTKRRKWFFLNFLFLCRSFHMFQTKPKDTWGMYHQCNSTTSSITRFEPKTFSNWKGRASVIWARARRLKPWIFFVYTWNMQLNPTNQGSITQLNFLLFCFFLKDWRCMNWER